VTGRSVLEHPRVIITRVRPVYGGMKLFHEDPHWRDLILFYEYFHGDNGAGLGASHQTGWTGLVARLIQVLGQFDAGAVLHDGQWPMARPYRRPLSITEAGDSPRATISPPDARSTRGLGQPAAWNLNGGSSRCGAWGLWCCGASSRRQKAAPDNAP
jgi:hypothetical protein